MALAEELDRSFGTGPALPPVEHRVAAGRRALRRRRLATGAATLGLVAAAVVGYAVVSPGPQGRADHVEVVKDPPPPVTGGAWAIGERVRYVDGVLEVRPGVTVHERVENPYGYRLPEQSDALDITYQGRRSWIIVEATGDGFASVSAQPSNGWASFGDWVADQVDLAVPGDDGWPATLRLTASGAVVASRGSEVLQRTDEPRLGRSFAPPGTPTGAAVVRAAEDGQSYFVVWRVLDGELDVITTPPDDVVGATFEELLSYARSQYASGEGLR